MGKQPIVPRIIGNLANGHFLVVSQLLQHIASPCFSVCKTDPVYMYKVQRSWAIAIQLYRIHVCT